MKLGVNASKFAHDTIDLSYGVTPTVGFYIGQQLTPLLSLTMDAIYAPKRSGAVAPFERFENHYLDLNLLSQYRLFNDYYFQGGITGNILLTSYDVMMQGAHADGIKKVKNNTYKSEINLAVGAGLRVFDFLFIEMNYFIPVNENHMTNLQFAFNIPFCRPVDDEVFKRSDDE
ncbi:MAG: hypothetical protein K9I94_11540 [Bacteroidales bacterium]|nr:hypothetical protein [Bacteroidales bacterium]